jgi:hypothetical protein
MLQIKAYVDLSPYDEITTFAGVEPERVVQSYIVTGESGTVAAQIIESLAAPLTASTAVQIISGKRGAGKSHLLSFLRAIIGIKSLRASCADARLTSALRLLTDRTPVAVELNFTGSTQGSFESVLQTAVGSALGAANDFNDERWAQAVSTERVFEQVISALPLDAQLIFFIDGLSSRWRSAPPLIEADLKWLTMLAQQAERLPLRAVIALDESDFELRNAEPAGAQGEAFQSSSAVRHQQFNDLVRQARIHYISPESLHEVIARHLLSKTPKQMNELKALYQQLKGRLPYFAWLEDEFTAYYPVHPALSRLAPVIRAHSRSFSLPGFIASSSARALNRPGLSLVVLDEVFDRYEYDLRKDELLEAAFALYDQLASKATASLPVADRLWAKMLAKSLFLFSLTPNPVSVRTLADSQLLFEEGSAESGYERAARILAHFEQARPDAIYAEGEGLDRRYLLASAHAKVSLEDKLSTAAREIATDDPRLAELLVTIGGQVFRDWQLSSEASESARPLAIPYEVVWRGTIRRGELRFDGAEEAEAGLVAGMALASETEDDLLGLEGEKRLDNRASDGGDDWRLAMVPFNCDLDLEAPSASTLALRWRAGLLNGEAVLQPLKMLLALNLRAEEADQRDEVERVRAELQKQIMALFTDLYLERGSLVDHRGPQPILPACRQTRSLAEFLSHALDATLSSCFPDHPRFEGLLTEEQVAPLVVGLFANSTSNEQTHELAARFAAPLGLVSEADCAYRLNIFSDKAISQPFVHRLFALIDKCTESSGLASVPLAEVNRALSGAPCGLHRAAQHLILGALIAGGLIELVNEATGERLAGANLHLGFPVERFTALRRVAPMDYPIEILTAWANQLTERLDLPAPATAEARRRVREAMGDWLSRWREQNLTARFEQLPMELLTMSTWQAVGTSKRRFERASSIVEAVLKETVALEAGLSRIVDVFSFDLGVLDHARAELALLSEFLEWLPVFGTIKNYLLTAETTGEAEIDRAQRQLIDALRGSRKLLDAEHRRTLTAQFEEFRKCYSDFYAAAHETSVGPSANRDLMESFYASQEWERFKLLMWLRLDALTFERDAESLVDLARETRCHLPITEILQRQPHCCCSFRLKGRLHLGSLLDALKAVTSAAIRYYSHTLWLRRDELLERMRARGDEQIAAVVETFLAACGDGCLDGLTPQIVVALNECLPDPIVAVMLPTPPQFGQGCYTKEELRARFAEWIESLPEQDGLRFRVERA